MLDEVTLKELVVREGALRINAKHLTATFDLTKLEQVYILAQIFALEHGFFFFRNGLNFVFVSPEYSALAPLKRNEKKCKGCAKIKAIELFFNSKKFKDGRDSHCSKCRLEKDRIRKGVKK